MNLSGAHPRTIRRLVAAISVTALAGSLAACGTPNSEKQASSDGPITIGISLPLTGDFSQPGTQARRGYEVWQEMVNKDGGILGRQVKLKITDDA